MNCADKLIELAEQKVISWEVIARECIAEMATDDVRGLCVVLGVDVDDDDDDDDDDDEIE